MGPPALPDDRRRDRRFYLPGYAILRSRAWTGTEVFGGLVDVSAGGARLRVKPGTRLQSGQVWAVDIEVALPQAAPAATPVRLWGCGSVVRSLDDATHGAEVALHFESPLVVVEGAGPPAKAPRTAAVLGA